MRAWIASTSSSVSERNWLRLSLDGSSIGPNRTRISRLTVIRCASNSRRTSLLRPSVTTTRYQRFTPSPPPSWIDSNRAGPSTSSIPVVNCLSCSGDSVPSTRTAYSRSLPKLGCIKALAKSPESVKISRPLVLKSRRPTDSHLPLRSRGRASNTDARPDGSSCETISPSGLW